jgi:hypothetical protein
MTGALAGSIGVESAFVELRIVQAGMAWHRQVRLGAGGWWQPVGCSRGDAPITGSRAEPPGGGVMCPACWPHWPAVRR